MRGLRFVAFGFLCMLLPLPPVRAGAPPAVGILGDSYSDEYQFYLPDRGTSRNWAEILAATRGLNFGQFTASSRGEPRNQGFAYNWARSEATSDDMIAAGQHTGLARQIVANDLKYVVIFIGGNDFIHALESDAPESSIERAVPRAVANFRLAVDTVLAASPDVRVVAATVPDVLNLPMFRQAQSSGKLPRALQQQLAAAIGRYNAEIRALGRSSPRVAVADFDLMTRLANRFSQDNAMIVGRRMDRVDGRNDSRHLFLADRRHLGTLGQGFLAQMFVNTLNGRFAAGIEPLLDRDVAEFAASLSTQADPDAVAELGAEASRDNAPRQAKP